MIRERIVGDVVVFDIGGRMTIEGRGSDLNGLVRQRIAAGHRSFLLNLGAVPYCDTRGLAELIASLTLAEGVEAQLKLANVRPYVYKLGCERQPGPCSGRG